MAKPTTVRRDPVPAESHVANQAANFDRKDLKRPDRVEAKLYELVQFVYVRRSQFIGGAIALVVALVALFGFQYFQEYQAEEKAQSFYQASKAWFDTSLTEAERAKRSAPEFESFVAEHPSSHWTPVALMYLAEIDASKNDFASAQQRYNQVIEHSEAAESMKQNARLSLLSLAINQKQWDLAETHLGAMGSSLGEDVSTHFKAQIAHGKGNTEQARQLWESLVEQYPDSPLKASAENMLMLH